MKRRGLTFVTAAVAAGCAIVGSGLATPAAAPAWQTVPGAGHEDGANVWAAGRLWFFSNQSTGGPFVIRSARVANGRLSGWVTSSLAAVSARPVYALLGDDLVFQQRLRDPNGFPVLQGVKLLASGRVGDPVDLGGGTPTSSSFARFFGMRVVRVRDRVVQLVGIPHGAGFAQDVGACCDPDGKAVNYRGFFSSHSYTALGVDRHGRVWLAWSDPNYRRPAGMVELDPSTLQPLGKPALVPKLTFSGVGDLVCGDRCRLVMFGAWKPRRDRSWSWAPGESVPTPIHQPTSAGSAGIIGARDSGGRLVVAYYSSDSHGGLGVAVARGNARGSGMRAVSSTIAVPQALGTRDRPDSLINTGGTFGPTFFAAVTVYESGGGGKGYVRVAILPA
jgi:hypothetical protein